MGSPILKYPLSMQSLIRWLYEDPAKESSKRKNTQIGLRARSRLVRKVPTVKELEKLNTEMKALSDDKASKVI